MALPAAMALSGLNEDHFDGLTDVFNHGALLLKSPSLTSISSQSSQESGISSFWSDSDSFIKNLGPLFDMLFNTRLQVKNVNAADCVQKPRPEKPVVKPKSIMYQNRDVLDLASNIQWKWNFQPAEIKYETKYFFENRSQYTRVLGAQIPEHVTIKCGFEGCEFEEPKYE
ncbi:hypothetical protein Zmor_015868 [Zophobas morio]|uniref:Uncharacterized protein n=1 Tax=Zophobas morio TaxID=2755281 RepID=A0AA38IKI6_9CUCU|nr:hypothetical protein Zmor_015868 [Zophobas morio]